MSTAKDAVVSFRVPVDMKHKLTQIAKEWRRTPASLMKQGLEYVFEDYEMENSIALQRKIEESRKSKKIPAEQVYKELGLL
jgi:predicted transcriptional regulator